jgi:dTDP-glucose 4,6-dehydratase
VRPERSEVERLWASNEKAKRLYPWKPRFGGRDGFREGLRQTIPWFTDPANLKQYRLAAYTL